MTDLLSEGDSGLAHCDHSPAAPDRRTGTVHVHTWCSPERGLWVAQSAGGYAGMVERIGGHFRVFDGAGADRGSFSTLAAAREALHESHLDPVIDQEHSR
jgi:hypothetical protein